MSVTLEEKQMLMECFEMDEESDFSKGITLMIIVYGLVIYIFYKGLT